MNSLLDSYKTLFIITLKNKEVNEYKNLYQINIKNHNFNINVEKKLDSLSTCLFYIFSHFLIIIPNDRYSNLNSLEKDEFIRSNKIDPVQLHEISHIDDDDSKYNLPMFLFEDMIIKINREQLNQIISFLRKKSDDFFFKDDFYKQLVIIQHLSLIEFTDSNLVFIENAKDKREFGKYYSPKRIIRYIYQILDILMNENEILSDILDPSCGSGLFLWYYILSIENNDINATKFQLKNISGFDIDFKALLTTAILLRQLIRMKNLQNKKINIIIDNKDYLIDKNDSDNNFDLIIGNPPYIRERFFNKEYRKKLKNYKTFIGKSDLYFAFIERSYYLLKPDGYLTFILPRYWIESDFGGILREFLKQKFVIRLIIDFKSFKLFDLGVHSSILFVQKKAEDNLLDNNNFKVLEIRENSFKTHEVDKLFLDIIELLKTDNYNSKNIIVNSIEQINLKSRWDIQSQEEKIIFDKIATLSTINLSSIVEIKEGINTGADKVSKNHLKFIESKNISLNDGIFVLTEKELSDLDLSDLEKKLFIKKWIKGKDIRKWIIHSQKLWLIYFKGEIDDNTAIYDHLYKFKEILENRAEMKRNPRRIWYELAWPRSPSLFDSVPKLLIRYKATEVVVAIDQEGYYTSADFRVLTVKKPYDPYVILAILNSGLVNWILKHIAKKLGTIHDYYSYILKDVPIMYPPEYIEKIIREKVKRIVEISQSSIHDKEISSKKATELKTLESSLNQQISELYKLTTEEIDYIKQDLKLNK